MTSPTAPAGSTVGTPLVVDQVRPTRRVVLHVVLGLLLYGAGANVQAAFVVVVAALLLATIPWGYWSARRAGNSVVVSRELPREAVAGVLVPATLHLRAATAAALVVRDHLTDTVGTATEAREGATLTGAARLRRGTVTGGRVEVLAYDLFGLFQATASADVPTTTEVIPAIAQVASGPRRIAWAVEAGEESARPGHGAEVIGAREYRQGDPMRTVHWRSSARRGQLVVRELADESRPRVLVEIAPGTWPVDALDRATEAAAGMAHDSQAAGYPTELAADGDRVVWDREARRLLAFLPPHRGADARPLAVNPPGNADVTVRFAAAEGGADVSVVTSDGERHLGRLPDDTTIEQVGAWLSVRVTG